MRRGRRGGGANCGNGSIGSDSVLGLGGGGLPGIAVAFDIPTHLTMGGGGGAGRQIATGLSSVSFGGFGGGAVFVRAASMTGAGKLQANGGSGEDSGLVGLPVAAGSEAVFRFQGPHALVAGGERSEALLEDHVGLIEA